MAVKKGLEAAGITVEDAELSMRAKVPATVSAETAKKVFRLIDNLEDSDDVQDVYHNMDITEEIAARRPRSDASGSHGPGRLRCGRRPAFVLRVSARCRRLNICSIGDVGTRGRACR